MFASSGDSRDLESPGYSGLLTNGLIFISVYVFDPSTPKPVTTVRNVSFNCKVISGVFCPPGSKEKLTDKSLWNNIGRLYYVNEKGVSSCFYSGCDTKEASDLLYRDVCLVIEVN